MSEQQHPTPCAPVPVTLADGRERHLRYTHAILRELNAKLGGSIRAHPEKYLEENLSEVVYAGLVEREDVNEERVAELIDAQIMEDITESVAAALFGKRWQRMKALRDEAQANVEAQVKNALKAQI